MTIARPTNPALQNDEQEAQKRGLVLSSTGTIEQQQKSEATLKGMFAETEEGRLTLSGKLRDGRFWELATFTTTNTPSGDPFTWYNAYVHNAEGTSARHAVFIQGGSISKARILEVRPDHLAQSIGFNYIDQGPDSTTDWHELLQIVKYDLESQTEAEKTATARVPKSAPGLVDRCRSSIEQVLSAEPTLAEA